MKNGVMNMYETLVPEHHQGRGIAGVLAKVLIWGLSFSLKKDSLLLFFIGRFWLRRRK